MASLSVLRAGAVLVVLRRLYVWDKGHSIIYIPYPKYYVPSPKYYVPYPKYYVPYPKNYVLDRLRSFFTTRLGAKRGYEQLQDKRGGTRIPNPIENILETFRWD